MAQCSTQVQLLHGGRPAGSNSPSLRACCHTYAAYALQLRAWLFELLEQPRCPQPAQAVASVALLLQRGQRQKMNQAGLGGTPVGTVGTSSERGLKALRRRGQHFPGFVLFGALYYSACPPQVLEDIVLSVQSHQVVAVGHECKHPWLLVVRRWDETPMRLRWGSVASCMADWCLTALSSKAAAGKLSQEQVSTIAAKTNHFNSGICNVLAQRASIRWSAEEASPVILTPVVIQRGTAACLRSALEMTLPEVSGAALARLSSFTRFICLVFIKDGASANLRLQADVGHDLPPNVLLVSGACDIHRVYRAIAMALAGQGIIGPLYSLSHLLRISDYWYKLMQGVGRAIASELIVISDTPDPAHQEWATAVLDHTLFRACRTRARSHEQWAGHAGHEGHGGLGSRGLANKQRVANSLLAIANYDWTQPIPVHCCSGPACCRDRAHSVQRFITAALDFTMAALAPTPALNRWHTVSANVGWWAAGIALHSLVPAGWVRALSSMNLDLDSEGPEGPDGPEQDPGNDDYHLVVGKRLREGGRFLREAENRIRIQVTNIITIPVDSFVQFVSASCAPVSGPSPTRVRTKDPMLLLMLMDHPSCLSRTLQQQMAEHLQAGSFLHRTLAAYSAQGHFSLEAIAAVLTISGGVWLRIQAAWAGYPWKVFSTLLPSANHGEVASEVFGDPACCKDRDFTLKLLAALSTPEDLLGGPVHDLLRCVALDLDTHIAEIERDHAGNKTVSAMGRPGATLSIEMLACQSGLRQWLDSYLQRGGPDSAKLSRSTLESTGVLPPRRSRGSRRSTRGGNPLWTYINHARRELGTGCPTSTELAQQYRALAAEEKAFWQDTYQQERAARAAHAAAHAMGEEGLQTTLQPADTLWGVGDTCWPLAATTLHSACRSCAGGLRGMSDSLRNEARPKLLVPQPAPTTQPRQPPPVPRTCWELHPGLCRTRDAAFYNSVVTAAKSLNRLACSRVRLERPFGSQRVFQFNIAGAAAADCAAAASRTVYMYLAHVLHAPKSTVWTMMEIEEGEDGIIILRFSLAGASLPFTTSFGLFASWFREGTVTSITAHQLEAFRPAAQSPPSSSLQWGPPDARGHSGHPDLASAAA